MSTNLCAILIGMTRTTTAKLVATDGVNIVGNFVTAPTYTKYQNNAPYKQSLLTSSIIYPYYGSLDIENANIRMQGECNNGLNIYSKAGEITCSNNTITYEAGAPTVCINGCYGINSKKDGIVYDNNRVDMSAATGTYINSGKSYPIIVGGMVPGTNASIKGSESIYKVNTAQKIPNSIYGGSSVMSIEDGTFIGAFQAKMGTSIW